MLLAFLNGLKRFWWYFLMFANNWIYWKVESLQHVEHETQQKISLICRKFLLDYLPASRCIIFQPNHFPIICDHLYKISGQGNIHHVWNVMSIVSEQNWGGYVGIGSLVCIVNLQIAPVANVLMRLSRSGIGTEDFSRQWLFSNPKTIIVKVIFVPGNSFLFW